MQVLEFIKEKKIIAIVRGIAADKIPALGEALYAGGICCVEVTFDQSSAEKSRETLAAIRALSEKLQGKICVGAGTVMTAEQVRLAAEAGAEYMISPNVDEDVIRETKKLGKVSIPGAFTATEAAQAYKYGADIVKIFPAGNVGPAYVKALKAPLKHIPFTAVGGVNVQNCRDFIKAGCIGIGVGGNLVSAELINAGRFDEITALAKEYVKAMEA